MTYNNGFPVGYGTGLYQPYYPQYQQPAQNQQPEQNGMIWIQGGINGAKNYIVAPNVTIPLWDSEEPIIYLKSSDSTGRPTIKILDYTIRGEKQNEENNTETVKARPAEEMYATKDDIALIRKELDQFRSKIDSLSSYKKDKRDNRNE